MMMLMTIIIITIIAIISIMAHCGYWMCVCVCAQIIKTNFE